MDLVRLLYSCRTPNSRDATDGRLLIGTRFDIIFCDDTMYMVYIEELSRKNFQEDELLRDFHLNFGWVI